MSKVKLSIRICRKLKPLFPTEELYLKVRFRLEMGYRLNLKHPKTFSEKIQWLKLYDHRPEYTMMVDKYAVKEFVSKQIGKEYVIPTLGVWNKPEEIDFDSLPNSFVLKTTHGGGSGGIVICNDKTTLNRKETIEKLKVSLRQDIAYYSCEWPYKNVPRKIIAEKLLEDPDCPGDLKDYKFFCFDGKVRFLKVDFNRFNNHQANYYDKDWNLMEFGEKALLPDTSVKIPKPETLSQMIILAEKLSHNLKFARIDFYSIGKYIFFGEITFYPASGFGKYEPDYWDENIGDMLIL